MSRYGLSKAMIAARSALGDITQSEFVGAYGQQQATEASSTADPKSRRY
jgi:hypothetical protein